MTESSVLPSKPLVSAEILAALRADYERFALAGAPSPLEPYLLDRYNLDVSAEYAGCPLKTPWGKGSGQLSMALHQVEEDIDAGLGFVVLKTVIAQNAGGAQSMNEWALREARMAVEPIVGQSGERGWTVTWKGRGWWQSFDEYLQLIRDARRAAFGTDTLIVPSCKYHLPATGEPTWNVEEYEWTTPRLLAAWRDPATATSVNRSTAAAEDSLSETMPLEKDFSPTLAGSDRATTQATVLSWLRTVPVLMRNSVASVAARGLTSSSSSSPAIRIGLKLFNALFDDDFQLAMLAAIHEIGPGRPDYFVYGNRLYDPDRVFDGHQGVAYGGPDLSDRNLRVMTRFHELQQAGGATSLPWSATGNIASGRTALEYALRGAGSFQLHTFFQLPGDQYAMRVGNRTQRALHELYFHPEKGLVVWMHHLAGALGLPHDPIRFRDVIGRSSGLQPRNKI